MPSAMRWRRLASPTCRCPPRRSTCGRLSTERAPRRPNNRRTKMYDFSYHRPKTLAEATAALKGKSEARPMSGGMTLIPTLKQRLAKPSDVVDLSGIKELAGIKVEGSNVTIGAMTRHADVATSKDVKSNIPALAGLASHIGDPQVRNRGTMGGSVANNDPAADYPAAVVALNATVTTNTRKIPADGFFKGLFETALEDGE